MLLCLSVCLSGDRHGHCVERSRCVNILRNINEEFSALVYAALVYTISACPVLETHTSQIHFSSTRTQQVAHIFQDDVM